MTEKIALLLAPPFWPNLPPLGLVTLAAFLHTKGYSPDIIDLNNFYFRRSCPARQKSWLKSCNKSLEDEISAMLSAEGVCAFDSLLDKEVIGFSCYKSNLESSLIIARKIKQLRPRIKFVLGGPEMAWMYFKNNKAVPPEISALADLVVVGEGEASMLAFLRGEINDKTVCFKEQAKINGYDFAYAYGKLSIPLYPKQNSVSLLSSRGCVRQCCFCSERLLYKRFRTRSVEDIIKEIAFHRKENKVQNFIFHDSMLNADLKFLSRLCRGIIDNFGTVPWEAQMAVRSDMPDELLCKIKQSGCYNIFVGLESGSSRMLELMRKGFGVDEAKRFFEQLHSHALFFGVSLIVGFPGETEEDCAESLRFLIENKALIPKIEQVNPFVYYPGTEADRAGDYRLKREILRRAEHVVRVLKDNRFKITNAFVNNLVEE